MRKNGKSKRGAREDYPGEALAIRFERFGGCAIRACDAFPKTYGARHIRDQLSRSATNAGAHYAEAQGTHTSKEFAYRVTLALREIREARYWLGVAVHAGYIDVAEELQRESTELVAILQASQQTMRKRRNGETRETGKGESEIGNRKSEIGNRKSEF